MREVWARLRSAIAILHKIS